MLKEYDVVVTKRDLNSKVCHGTKGAIMLILNKNPIIYEVEFVDDNGETIGLLSVKEEDLELIEN